MAKYLHAADWILTQIAKLDLKENDKIPPEMQISQTLGISRQTVRNAIEYLESQGILTSIQGSGTYITRVPTAATAPIDSNPSSNIAVITTYLDSYIFPHKINGINNALLGEGYMMNLLATNNSMETENSILSSLLDRDFAGMIIEPSRSALPRIRPDLLMQLSNRFPTVLIDSYYPNLSLPYIAIDDLEGGYIATKYLLDHGHHNILHVGKMDDQQGILRYQGYLKALEEYQITPREIDILWYTNETSPNQFLETQKDRILESIEACTAIFCYNDLFASALIPFLQMHDFCVPDDISVVGYDNSPLALLNVPLTTIAYPFEELGLQAVHNLLQLMKNPDFDANHRFYPKLIERDSVRHL